MKRIPACIAQLFERRPAEREVWVRFPAGSNKAFDVRQSHSVRTVLTVQREMKNVYPPKTPWSV